MKTNRIFIVFAVLIIVALAATSTALANGTLKPDPKVKILVQGAPIHGGNGLYVGPNGNLYIASTVGKEIIVMNPDSGIILQRFDQLQGVNGPDDVFVGPDGSIYWTDILVGQVAKMTPDGVKTILASGLPGVNAITFSADGRLFVACDFWGTGLYEIDPNGINPPRAILPDLVNLNGFDFGPDGWLYGPIFGGSAIVRINVDTAEMQTISDFSGASAKFDSQGRLHVVSYETGEVVRINLVTGTAKVIARLKEGLDSLAFSADDRLFVVMGGNGAIVEVLPKGKTRTVSPGGLIYPAGVAVKSDAKCSDRVFVADFWTVREYNGKSGKLLSQTHTGMAGPMVPPTTISADGDHFVISSFMGNAVQVWDPETNTILESYPVPNIPMNAIRFQGDLIVAELMTGQVVRLNASGSTPLAQFYVPSGLAATEDDLWVADYAAGVVYQVVADGVLLAQPAPVASGLSGPEGLAVDGYGNLLVVESVAGRLSKIDLQTGTVSLIADGLQFRQPFPNDIPFNFLNSVAVGVSGTAYVTGDQTNVLYSIKINK